MKGRIWFKIKDAELYGEKAAIILANLQWQQDNGLPHVTDAKGLRYYPLGSAKLSHHLPMSRWTIARQLEQLSQGTSPALILHPSQPNHYVRVHEDHTANSARAEVEQHVAEVDGDVAEGDKIQKGDSNIDCNKDEKWFYTPALAEASPAPKPLMTSSLNPENDKADKLDSNQPKIVSRYANECSFTIVTDDEEQPLDLNTLKLEGLERVDYINSLIEQELPCDHFPNFQRFQDDLDDKTNTLVEAFRYNRMECTADDQRLIRQIYFDNPQLTDQLIDILATCSRLQDPNPMSGPYMSGYIKVEDTSCLTFPRRVNSARYFLYRMPEIIAQLSGGFDKADEELQQMDFSYLGGERINEVVQLYRNGIKIESVRVDHCCCPV
jgi:hypothetical protein